MSKIDFQCLVSSKSTVADVLRYFSLHVGAGNYKTFYKRVKEENIDISHFDTKESSLTTLKRAATPLDQILVENSLVNRNHLKERLIKEGLLKNQCYICGQLPEWNGKPLVLQMDHINGISNDNRLENLRILCPHCHSQTSNFSGKNSSMSKKHKCLDCPTIISGNFERCINCSNKQRSLLLKDKNTKINWPTTDLILDMIKNNGYVGTGKLLGVSDNTIRKRIKNYPI